MKLGTKRKGRRRLTFQNEVIFCKCFLTNSLQRMYCKKKSHQFKFMKSHCHWASVTESRLFKICWWVLVASRIRGENEMALHNGKPFYKLYTLNYGSIRGRRPRRLWVNSTNVPTYMMIIPIKCLLFIMAMKRWWIKTILTEIQLIKKKTDKPYFRTAPSVLEIANARQNDEPFKVHGDILDAVPP